MKIIRWAQTHGWWLRQSSILLAAGLATHWIATPFVAVGVQEPEGVTHFRLGGVELAGGGHPDPRTDVHHPSFFRSIGRRMILSWQRDATEYRFEVEITSHEIEIYTGSEIPYLDGRGSNSSAKSALDPSAQLVELFNESKTMEREDEKEDLIKAIGRAFPVEPLPDEHALFDEMDDEAMSYHRFVQGVSWPELGAAPYEVLESMMYFLKHESFPYYLAFFLVQSILDPEGREVEILERTLFPLDDPGQIHPYWGKKCGERGKREFESRLSKLNLEQRKAVTRTFAFLAHADDRNDWILYEGDNESVYKKALDRYWSRYL